MRVRRVVTAACVLALATLAACSDDGDPGSAASSGSSPSASTSASTGASAGASTSSSTGASVSSSTSASTSAPASPDASSRYPTYVALGDSYTAAPGNPVTDLTTGCSQSDHNYPHLLAARLGTQLDDVSCSGASTASLVGVQEAGSSVRPAQFDALQPDTSLVTLGMGGNDDNLFATVIGTCLGVASQDSQGSPCKARFTAGGSDQLLAQVREVGGLVTAALEGVLDRSPDATVLAIGYPQPVPASGTCTLLPLATGDYAYARMVVSRLNQAIEKAADKAGATYVDVAAASEGHDICAGDQAWVNGLVPDSQRAIAFHPFPEEQQAVAGLIEAALTG